MSAYKPIITKTELIVEDLDYDEVERILSRTKGSSSTSKPIEKVSLPTGISEPRKLLREFTSNPPIVIDEEFPDDVSLPASPTILRKRSHSPLPLLDISDEDLAFLEGASKIRKITDEMREQGIITQSSNEILDRMDLLRNTTKNN